MTIDAAYQLHLDHEIGSLEAGKKADIAILAEDPLSVDPVHIKDVNVLGTLLAGELFPLPGSNVVIPLTIIGGYLGAGKSTLLQRLVREPERKDPRAFDQ